MRDSVLPIGATLTVRLSHRAFDSTRIGWQRMLVVERSLTRANRVGVTIPALATHIIAIGRARLGPGGLQLCPTSHDSLAQAPASSLSDVTQPLLLGAVGDKETAPHLDIAGA